MINLKINWKYCLAFYCMVMLYSSLHELVHHFTGYIICGEWGYKTFNSFKAACGSKDSSISFLTTYSWPIFSFSMMWIGAFLLKRKNTSTYIKQLSFAMIFAQMPAQRMLMCFFKMNDEYYMSSKLFGHTPQVYWLVIIIIWLCCLPPLITAYKAIRNKHKILWFLFYLLLFPYLLWGPVFVLLEYLLVNKHVMNGTIIGIANLFILNEVVTVIGYLFTKKYFNTSG